MGGISLTLVRRITMSTEKKKKKQTFQTPRGTKDILPEEQKYWAKIRKVVPHLAESYGFERIDTPILEYAELFTRSIGTSTDIVSKEMYTLSTKGGDMLALRPENTAGIVRAYLQYGMVNLPQPVKLYYIGPMFRHEQPQHGRYRQFHQFGFEVIGEGDPVIDAQLIHLSHVLLRDLGLKNLQIKVNSIGDKIERRKYRGLLQQYYRSRVQKLCKNCKVRLKVNPLRLLDCKEEKCMQLKSEAPQIIDHLSRECHTHFKEVLEFLEELELPYLLDPYLVRGLDYYTRTVFEIIREGDERAQNTLLAGGRYDRLAEELGGKPTPGAGASGGIERIIQAMQHAEIRVEGRSRPQVFLTQLGDLGRRKSLRLFEELRKAGIFAAESLGKTSIKTQLKIANRLGVRFSLILGQKEALDGNVIVREMDSGIQETIPLTKVIAEVKKRLAKKPHP